MVNMTTQVILFVSTLLQIAFARRSQGPLVQLPNGRIFGRTAETSESNSYYAFERIPYAAPPVGNLRFKPPQPVANWDGTLNTTHLDVACHQNMRHQTLESEDCLFLNVYTPKLTKRKCSSSLPVMLYIHGGGFMTGYSFRYQPDLFIDNGVILVTINYRLGAFGFLSTQDSVIPGNNGLKDQLQALQWTRDNIHLFGGDPNKVTIFGQSSGSGSCGYQLLNQNSKGLFSGVILESGTFLTHGMYERSPRTTAFGVAALLNSTFQTSNDSQALYKFLQSVDAKDLTTASEQYAIAGSNIWDRLVRPGGIWAPVLEPESSSAFLTEKMYVSLKAGNILPVPTMMGFTSEESISVATGAAELKNVLENVDANIEAVVPKDMRITDSADLTRMGQSIRKIYTGGEPFADHLGAGVRFSSDNGITRPMLKHAELFSKIAPTYFYQFSYDGAIGGTDIHYDGAETVGHAEELGYIFCGGLDCNNSSYPESDLLTRKRLIQLWTNFAKYRNPVPEITELLQNISWPKVSTENSDFFYLDINKDLSVKNLPKWDTYEGWTQLYDSLGYDDFDTY